ncbi:unnamed protein product [Zymoseptoria tritici ST99CH_1A5]|uniref:Uncharacterized protein n=1 Tax=Zymoseptoria tritici ST99CH_1A5 TaxID=1276529 RepID=A0A1Y6LY50_ZYMTR|nr:unnamed protein product [Zymoseptoria tritici ST99CH_1A5]
MAEVESNDLFAIDVDPDNYAETAAHDNLAPESRTFQSEEAFQAQKASYSAKIDTGDHYSELMKTVPALAPSNGELSRGAESASVEEQNLKEEKFKLGKRDVMLLGYAVGEMYYDGKYAEVVELCGRVEGRCLVDKKMAESLRRWRERCEVRMREGA